MKNPHVLAQTYDPSQPRPNSETLSQKSLSSTLRIHYVNRFVRSRPGFQLVFLAWMTGASGSVSSTFPSPSPCTPMPGICLV